MKIFYTSSLSCPKTADGKLVAQSFSGSNNFIDLIKQHLKQRKKLMIISNRWAESTPNDQPADEVFNDYHYTNQEYANTVNTCFQLSGVKFDEVVLVDQNYDGNFEQDLISSDLVYIQSGHTPRGLKILKNLHFKKFLKNYHGILLLTGTATKLLATKVLSTHHGNMKEYEIEDGLGLRDYSIRPFFNYSLRLRLNKKFRVRIKLLKNFSKQIPTYAIGDEGFVLDNNGQLTFYGNCWSIDSGKIKKISTKTN